MYVVLFLVFFPWFQRHLQKVYNDTGLNDTGWEDTASASNHAVPKRRRWEANSHTHWIHGIGIGSYIYLTFERKCRKILIGRSVQMQHIFFFSGTASLRIFRFSPHFWHSGWDFYWKLGHFPDLMLLNGLGIAALFRVLHCTNTCNILILFIQTKIWQTAYNIMFGKSLKITGNSCIKFDPFPKFCPNSNNP